MSERITGELRRAMRIDYTVEDGEQVDAIRHGAFMDLCAAIDSIHANLERENDRLKCELDRVLGELDEMHKTEEISDNSGGFMHNEEHYVMLPMDADGVPIHIGDVMEGVDKYDSLKEVMGKVITISFESDGIVDVAIQAWSSDGKSWHRAYLDQDASIYRHHHADSWERIIEDACKRAVDGYPDKGGCIAMTDLVARCKALAGGAE